MNQELLRLPQVRQATGLARSTIYGLVAANRFPPPIKLGVRATGWVASEVFEWISQRIAESRKAA